MSRQSPDTSWTNRICYTPICSSPWLVSLVSLSLYIYISIFSFSVFFWCHCSSFSLCLSLRCASQSRLERLLPLKYSLLLSEGLVRVRSSKLLQEVLLLLGTSKNFTKALPKPNFFETSFLDRKASPDWRNHTIVINLSVFVVLQVELRDSCLFVRHSSHAKLQNGLRELIAVAKR